MRTIIVGLSIIAGVCAAAVVAFLVIAWRLWVQNAMAFSGSDQPTEREIEEAQRVARLATALGIACGPLTAAALIAVVAILALLTLRWELVRR